MQLPKEVLPVLLPFFTTREQNRLRLVCKQWNAFANREIRKKLTHSLKLGSDQELSLALNAVAIDLRKALPSNQAQEVKADLIRKLGLSSEKKLDEWFDSRGLSLKSELINKCDTFAAWLSKNRVLRDRNSEAELYTIYQSIEFLPGSFSCRQVMNDFVASPTAFPCFQEVSASLSPRETVQLFKVALYAYAFVSYPSLCCTGLKAIKEERQAKLQQLVLNRYHDQPPLSADILLENIGSTLVNIFLRESDDVVLAQVQPLVGACVADLDTLMFDHLCRENESSQVNNQLG